MSVVAMESYCMKTVIILLVDKSDVIISQNTLQIFAVILVQLVKSEDCDFFCPKLVPQKVSVSCKYKYSHEISTKHC